MLPLNHARVVRMLGVCTLDEPTLIIEEFMANGNLHTFLAKVDLLLLVVVHVLTFVLMFYIIIIIIKTHASLFYY